MTTVLTVLCVLVFLSAAVPIVKKVFDKVSLDVAANQLDLLTAVVKEAVSNVNQVSKSEDLSSEEKKELAVDLSKKLASNMRIPEKQQALVGDLIESAIWAMKSENYFEDD